MVEEIKDDDDYRDLKQPGTSLWTSSKAGKTKSLSKLPSRFVAEVGRLHLMASFKEIRELVLFSVENTIKKNFSYSPKDLNW